MEEKKRDWVEILVAPLLIGIIATILTGRFNMQQDERQRQIEEQRAQDAALQAYLDQMSVLRLEADLHDLEGKEQGVSRSGYYAWRNRSPSERARFDAVLSEKIER